MNSLIREFYENSELNGDSRWAGMIGQMDQITFFNLAHTAPESKISITCIRREMDWIARILNEVIKSY